MTGLTLQLRSFVLKSRTLKKKLKGPNMGLGGKRSGKVGEMSNLRIGTT
jgi:hypothetical protein